MIRFINSVLTILWLTDDFCLGEWKMKAISIVNQVGQKITLGEKTLEIRKWQSNIDAEEELLIVENSRYLESDMAAACTSYYELG